MKIKLDTKTLILRLMKNFNHLVTIIIK
jgi:hypothetical protein